MAKHPESSGHINSGTRMPTASNPIPQMSDTKVAKPSTGHKTFHNTGHNSAHRPMKPASGGRRRR